MGRVRSVAAVLPALLPGACVVLLAFQAGGYFPSSWAPLAAVAIIALAVRLVTVERPFAGLSPASAVAGAALALFGVWILLSSTWSDATGRALVEFGRLLAYLAVFVLCASLAPRENRLSWAIRGVAVAILVVCIAALISRLRPDILSEEGILAGRLDYPITYWNALGMLGSIGVVLGLHLTASDQEPWPVRVLAAAIPPVAAVTVYFTLSRGGISAGVAGIVIYLLLGSSRATPGALLALIPACFIALTHAYDADLLVTADFTSAAGRAQGRDVATVLLLCTAGAVALRALALLIDRALESVPGPGRLPLAGRIGIVAVTLFIAVTVAVAAGAPGYAHRQIDAFLNAAPEAAPSDVRQRLTVVSNNGRVAHWRVALDAFRAEPLHGNGAGTFQNLWNRDRRSTVQVVDAHSLYIETLGEMGIVGLALIGTALIAILVGLVMRLRGPGRPASAAVLAATVAWALHAGVDWDWELAAVTVWVFGLGGIALARDAATQPRTRPLPRLVRLVAAIGCLVLAISPAALWRSQVRLQDAVAAFNRGDCPATIDAALDSVGAVGARAEPWELIAYCDYRLGQPRLAVDAADAAVRRDAGDWEYHYALALVRGATGQDPRAAAAEALRLNPREQLAQNAVKAFRTNRKAQWQRRATRLPLYFK